MLLLRIEISNIRQYKNTEIFFPQKGLIGIRGDNGAGKSTIFNTFDWVLYGKYKGVAKQEQLIPHDEPSKSKTYAVVDFLYQDNFFRVRRDLSSSTKKNFVQKNGRTVAAGTTNLNDYIKDLFKMDQESFRTCYYASQDDFDSLAKLNSSPRVQMVSKLLRLETIDYAAARARKEISVLEIEIEEAKRHIHNEEEINKNLLLSKTEINETTSKLAILEKELKEVEFKRDELFRAKKTSDETYEKYQSISNIISNTQTKKQTLTDHSLHSFIAQLNTLKEKDTRLQSIKHQKERYFMLLQQKDELNEAKEQFLSVLRLEKQKKESLTTLNNLENSLVEVEKRLNTFNELEEQMKQLEISISSKETELSLMRDNTQQIRTILSVNKNKYQELQSEITGFEQLGKDTPCPTCKRPLGEHQSEHLQQLEKNKKEIILHTAQLKGKYDELTLNSTELKRQTDILKDSLRTITQKMSQKSGFIANKENYLLEKNRNNSFLVELNKERKQFPETITFDVDSYKQLVEEIRNLVPLYEETIQLENAVNEIPVVKEKIEQVNLQISELEAKINGQIDERNLLAFNKEQHITLSNQVEELHTTIDNIKVNKYSLHSRSEVLSNTIKEIENTIKENEKKRESQKDKQLQIMKLTKLDQLFKTYKKDKFAKLSPTLSDIMSEMIDVITDGRYDQVKVDDQFNIFVYVNGKPHPLDIFSGGEQKLAALCQRIAISQLLVSQTGQASFDMIALDEVFGSQDAKRQDSMIDMFRNLNSMFSQILIISHSENVKDMFDHTLHIDLNGKNSNPKWITDEYGKPTWNEEEVREYVAKNFDNINTIDETEEVS